MGISESQAMAIKQLAFNCLSAMKAFNEAKTFPDQNKARIRLYQSKKDFEEYLESITVR